MKKEITDHVLLRKHIQMNRAKTITNIFLILILTAILSFTIKEVNIFKTLNQDVCRLCEYKTGGECLTRVAEIEDCIDCKPIINASEIKIDFVKEET